MGRFPLGPAPELRLQEASEAGGGSMTARVRPVAPGLCRLSRWLLALLGLAWAGGALGDGPGCLACHSQKVRGFVPGHSFGPDRCESCHRGDPGATSQAEAHSGLVVFPGDLATADSTCGACHAEQVRSVRSGPMATGRQMVSVTRFAFGERASPSEGHDGLDALGHTPADSLLRKLCASCHLGQEKEAHEHDVVADRGGGCAACHVNSYPSSDHPALTRRVEDGRCFGCHSRSSRIALSYAGLAEVLPGGTQKASQLARLGDGRLLRRLPADIHHRAGMACIDCHTGPGLMGGVESSDPGGTSVDIGCEDCHANPNSRIARARLPAALTPETLPFEGVPDQPFLTTAQGTPLWHLEVRPQGSLLHLKTRPGVLPIPALDPEHHPDADHERLACTACHSTWAPQCNGCHLSFDSEARQWDHLAQGFSRGRWMERRWGFRQHAPTLGVDGRGRIVPFVPGMILRLEHPDWETARFRRLFAPLAPHTTGAARSCTSCHASPPALGLGSGKLSREGGEWAFDPQGPPLEDGLPADAWTALDGGASGSATREGARALSRAEILRILEAPTGAEKSRP